MIFKLELNCMYVNEIGEARLIVAIDERNSPYIFMDDKGLMYTDIGTCHEATGKYDLTDMLVDCKLLADPVAYNSHLRALMKKECDAVTIASDNIKKLALLYTQE